MRIKTLSQVFQKFIFCLFLSSIFSVAAQRDPNIIIAKSGDGIFSLLRKSGMDPIKYYEPFLLLNQEYIKNGSELSIGREYKLPPAPDSFKVMGTRIVTGKNLEQPIFDESHLSLMKKKDSSLRNTVYYFAYSGNQGSKERFEKVIVTLSQNLMEKGARIYILEADLPSDSLDSKLVKSRYGDYSSVINKKYLMHRGSYQRVILLQDNNLDSKGDFTMLVSYNERDTEGSQLANSLNQILSKNLKFPSKVKDETKPFKDDASLFFANNLVPPVIILSWVKSSEGFNLKNEKKSLANLLNDGILEDYSQLNLEEN